MAKRLSSQERIDQAIKDLINEMFKIAGHDVTYDDIKDRKDEWYREFTMTQEESNAFKDYAIRYLKRELKTGYYKADTEYQWFDLMWRDIENAVRK